MSQTQLVSEFLENRDTILAFIFALTRDYDVAEESLQEVSLAIIQEASRAADIRHFMPWSREIAPAARPRLLPPVGPGRGGRTAGIAGRRDRLHLQGERGEPGTAAGADEYLLQCLERLPDRGREVIRGNFTASASPCGGLPRRSAGGRTR